MSLSEEYLNLVSFQLNQIRQSLHKAFDVGLAIGV